MLVVAMTLDRDICGGLFPIIIISTYFLHMVSSDAIKWNVIRAISNAFLVLQNGMDIVRKLET
jgi:hypothetical protein